MRLFLQYGRLFLTTLCVWSLSSCVPLPSVWDSAENWYQGDTVVEEGLVDVFYVLSTNFIDSYDADSTELFRIPLTKEEKTKMDREFSYAQFLFGDSMNFFAPYYHQFTIDATDLPEAEFESVRAAVAEEVCEAFDYYMSHFNQGRRFILAGFSQGACLTVDILKHLSEETYQRLVAVYALGCQLREEDLRCPYVKPATGPDGQGEIISFNSVMDVRAYWPFRPEGSVACINPLNWRTDAVPAQLTYHGDTASVEVEPTHKVLLVKGLSEEKYQYPMFGKWTQPGSLHHWDLLFYRDAIRQNAMRRAYGGTY